MTVASGQDIDPQDIIKTNYAYAASGGSANAYTIDLVTAPSAYSDGLVLRSYANFSNTGAATANINSLGAIPIKTPNGSDLTENDILMNTAFELTYKGGVFFLTSPKNGAPFFYQRVAVPGETTSFLYHSASNPDGSILVTISDSQKLKRYVRDANTGVYILTHAVVCTPQGNFSSLVVVGNYVYVFDDPGSTVACYRYDLADLTNETLLTMPSIDTSGTNYSISTWTDGTYIYLLQAKASTTAYKLSISGTTLATVTTSATAAVTGNSRSFMFDGTNQYYLNIADGVFTIYKANDVFFSAPVSTTKLIGYEIDSQVVGAVIINIDAMRMYIGYQMDIYDETAVRRQVMVLIPVTKP